MRTAGSVPRQRSKETERSSGLWIRVRSFFKPPDTRRSKNLRSDFVRCADFVGTDFAYLQARVAWPAQPSRVYRLAWRGQPGRSSPQGERSLGDWRSDFVRLRGLRRDRLRVSTSSLGVASPEGWPGRSSPAGRAKSGGERGILEADMRTPETFPRISRNSLTARQLAFFVRFQRLSPRFALFQALMASCHAE